MDSFTKFLEKAQKNELKNLRKKLNKKYKKEAERLNKKYQEELEEVESAVNSHKKMVANQKKYLRKKRVEFTLQKEKNKILRKAFKDSVKKVLRSAKNKKKWLKKGLKNIDGLQEGDIYAGESYNILKSLVGNKHSLINDKDINESGFVFENERLEFDYKLSSVSENFYKENKTMMAILLFDKK